MFWKGAFSSLKGAIWLFSTPRGGGYPPLGLLLDVGADDLVDRDVRVAVARFGIAFAVFQRNGFLGAIMDAG